MSEFIHAVTVKDKKSAKKIVYSGFQKFLEQHFNMFNQYFKNARLCMHGSGIDEGIEKHMFIYEHKSKFIYHGQDCTFTTSEIGKYSDHFSITCLAPMRRKEVIERWHKYPQTRVKNYKLRVKP